MSEKPKQLATVESSIDLRLHIPSEFSEEFERRLEAEREQGTPEAKLVEQAIWQWLCIPPNEQVAFYEDVEVTYPGGFAGVIKAAQDPENAPEELGRMHPPWISDKTLDEVVEQHTSYRDIASLLQSKRLSPALSKLLEEDSEAAVAFAKKAHNASCAGPNGEMIAGLFTYQLEGYGAPELDENMENAREIIRKFSEHGAGMDGYEANRKLDEILQWYMSPNYHEFIWLLQLRDGTEKWLCDPPTYQREYLKSIFGRKAEPHLLALTFSEFTDAGLHPELTNKLMQGPLAEYLDEAYDMDGRYFTPVLWAEEDCAHFIEVKELYPEFEEAIMAMVEATKVEYLLKKDGKVKVTELHGGITWKVPQQHDMTELMKSAEELIEKMEGYQDNPIYRKHCDFSLPIKELRAALSMSVFKREFKGLLGLDEKPIKSNSLLGKAVNFHELEEVTPELQGAAAALTEAENLEYLFRRLKYPTSARTEYEKQMAGNHDLKDLVEKAESLIPILRHYQDNPPTDVKGESFAKVINYLREDIKKAKATIRIIETKDKLRLLIKTKEQTGPLANASDTTRIIVGGTALMMALGVSENPKLGAENMALPESNPNNAQELLALVSSFKKDKYWDTVMSRIKEAVPKIEQFILEQRTTTPGLMPIGGKVHVENSVDPELAEFFRELFGLNSTAFHMAHAGHSIILPPTPSAAEQSLLLMILEKTGILDSKSPELQTAMAGRWSNEIAGMVGSAMLLGTRRGVRYKKGAFSTTHDDQTGARIMSYDDGVKKEGLPFDLPNAKGRTDMLGRRTHTDVDMYQVLGTLATHLEYGGMFEPEAERFRIAYADVLKRHGLSETVRSSAWIFGNQSKGDDLKRHEEMIAGFTEKWFEGFGAGDKRRFGIIGEVRKLILETSQNMQSRSGEIASAKSEDFKRLKKY